MKSISSEGKAIADFIAYSYIEGNSNESFEVVLKEAIDFNDDIKNIEKLINEEIRKIKLNAFVQILNFIDDEIYHNCLDKNLYKMMIKICESIFADDENMQQKQLDYIKAAYKTINII